MNEINGYRLLTEFCTVGSGSARWCYAARDGREFFVKEFLTPVYPINPASLPESVLLSRRRFCEQFEERKRRLYRGLKLADNGNLVVVEDFFRDGGRYYIATARVPDSSISVENAHLLPAAAKIIIMRTLAHCLTRLSDQRIVHADMKPSNIMLKETVKGFFALKLIDFDNSFFEDDPPADPEAIQGDCVYLAPETFLAMCGEPVALTHRIDVFALGVIFHQILAGEYPSFDRERYAYLYEAALGGGEIALAPAIPAPLAGTIAAMLLTDPEKRPEYREIFERIGEAAPLFAPRREDPPAREISPKNYLRPAGNL